MLVLSRVPRNIFRFERIHNIDIIRIYNVCIWFKIVCSRYSTELVSWRKGRNRLNDAREDRVCSP